MSRSYRRPFCSDGYKGSKRKQFEKREANKRIRNAVDVPNGNTYRKFFENWDICDYHYYVSPRDLEKHWPEWWKLVRK